jgi:hypothetical protein
MYREKDSMVGIRLELIGRCVLGLVLCSATLSACGGSDTPGTSSTTPSGTPPATTGTTVQVSVNATDPDGDTLHYRWAVTEGTINNVDKSSTTWTVPPGSGLQFAYVLVSDNKGGYTEFRAAGLTMAAVPQQSSASITPPADSGKGFIWGTLFYDGFGRQVYLPDWDVQVTGPDGTFDTKTDMKGEFFFPGLNLAATYSFSYKIPGQANFTTTSQSISTSTLPTSPSSPTYSRQKVTLTGTLHIAGTVRMNDRLPNGQPYPSYCGVRDEFFTRPGTSNMLDGPISGTVELLDANNNTVGTPNPRPRATVNHYGDYLIVLNQLALAPVGPKVRVRCEDLIEDRSVNLAALSGQQNGPFFTLDNSRPVVNKMTVTLNGRDVGRPDLPTPVKLKTIPEMDLAPGDDAFLAYKGLDTRKGACAYYKAIGAVQGCDADGFPTGAQLTLSQWRKNFNLSAGDPNEVTAQFVNSMDLNFGRDYQGIKLPNDVVAINVCNYPGPQDVTSPDGRPRKIGEETQADINLSIENMRRGIGKIVCVAMDYSAIPNINGGNPFIKFYIFGPTEKLLLSVSLDGRREKFMPGVCVGCHGGDNYGGNFPEDGSGRANIGSYFLPFDVANFAFSTSDPTLTRDKLLGPLRQLNELLTSIPVSQPTKPVTTNARSLITTQWYPNDTTNEQQLPVPPNYLNQQIVGNGTTACTVCHASGSTPGPLNAEAMYSTVIGPSCAVCHASNSIVGEPLAGGQPPITFFGRPPGHYLRQNGLHGPHTVCGGSQDLKMNHTMPNALATFERFWLTPDQPAALFTFFFPPNPCATPIQHPDL